ncbi:hypothetical protein E4U36_000056 [Claviceps purpurea]|nr:hypothetical protein E4U36_000056 [Claviceps purpurea]
MHTDIRKGIGAPPVPSTTLRGAPSVFTSRHFWHSIPVFARDYRPLAFSDSPEVANTEVLIDDDGYVSVDPTGDLR